MELIDKRALRLQEYIMSFIPETIDTDAGTHIYLLHQERLKIAKAVADGLTQSYCEYDKEEIVEDDT